MLKITIELYCARTKMIKELATAFISNTGDGTKEEGIYDIQIHKTSSDLKIWKRASGFKFKKSYLSSTYVYVYQKQV